MDKAQAQGQEKGQGDLVGGGAGQGLLLHPQAAQQGIAPGVVRPLGQLLEGQHRCGGQQEGKTQIQPQKQHQDLRTHGLLIQGQTAVYPDVRAVQALRGTADQGEDRPLRRLLVPGVVR